MNTSETLVPDVPDVPGTLGTEAPDVPASPTPAGTFGESGTPCTPGIRVCHLYKRHKTHSVFEDLSFKLAPGKTLSIIGPSGCGKSTLLYLLAGLDKADSGLVETVPQVAGSLRARIAFILQDYGLFPWKTVEENLTLPLLLQGMPRHERIHAMTAMLEELGLQGLEARYPPTLSGGQRQRVAIGRALVTSPDILLMDEPFSSLDALTREHLQQTVLTLCLRRQLTCVLVTHSVPEAVFLGQQIMVLTGHPAQCALWLENPHYGDATCRRGAAYYETINQVYTALGGEHEQTEDDFLKKDFSNEASFPWA